MAGCRDCDACTKPALWRLMVLFLLTWWVWALRVMVSTCPQRGHVMGRHQRRADRSFRD